MSNSIEITFHEIEYIRHLLVAKGTLSFTSNYEDEKGNIVPYTKEKPFTVAENERGGFIIEAKSEHQLSDMEENLILLSLNNKTNMNEGDYEI